MANALSQHRQYISAQRSLSGVKESRGGSPAVVVTGEPAVRRRCQFYTMTFGSMQRFREARWSGGRRSQQVLSSLLVRRPPSIAPAVCFRQHAMRQHRGMFGMAFHRTAIVFIVHHKAQAMTRRERDRQLPARKPKSHPRVTVSCLASRSPHVDASAHWTASGGYCCVSSQVLEPRVCFCIVFISREACQRRPSHCT